MTHRLGDLVEVYRGKVILKAELHEEGDTRVLNVSNIQEVNSQEEGMDRIQMEASELSKYQVREGDLVMTARGTKFKSALIRELPSFQVILSGNLLGIRSHDALLMEYLHILFQSPEGKKRVGADLSVGESINIGKKNVEEMHIPMIPRSEMESMVDLYRNEQKSYLQQMKAAETRWRQSRNRIFSQLADSTRWTESDVPRPKTSTVPRQIRKKESLFIELD